MKMLLPQFLIGLALFSAAKASPYEDLAPYEDLDSDQYRVKSIFVRAQLQSFCEVQSECSSFNNVSSELVNCIDGECICNKCFYLENGKCTTCSEYKYSNDGKTCGEDRRPKHLTAVLLSIFLSATGAANFYVGQIRLGAAQLLILFGTITGYLSLCGCLCCIKCSDDEAAATGSTFISCGMLAWSVFGSFILMSWWIADILIFVFNFRLSGGGCSLA